MLFMQYLQNNGERVTLEAIEKPGVELSDNQKVLEAGLHHERYVTSLIHTIYEAAYAVKDFRTMQFLDWFVKEQGEEENNADSLVKNMNCMAMIPEACICWIAKWLPGYTPRPLWFCKEKEKGFAIAEPFFIYPPGWICFLYCRGETVSFFLNARIKEPVS